MEKFLGNFSPCMYLSQTNFESVSDKKNNVATRDFNIDDVQHGKTSIQRQNKLNAKPIRDTCYHFNGRDHISNVCPTSRVVAVVEEIEKEEERE